jgi:tetratricopeptide (TPR) repeat protein
MLATCASFGQDKASTLGRLADLRGRVYVARNVPAPHGAMVQLEASLSGTVGNTQTDSNGTFQFLALIPTQYQLHIRLPGYEPYQQSFDLTVNTHGYAVINLKPLPSTSTEAATLPGDTLSVRDAAIPPAAVKEFKEGKKLLLEKNDPGGSIGHLRKAIKAYSEFPQAYVLLGIALSAQKNLKEAEEALLAAIRIDDKMGDAYIALGMLQNQEKKFADSQRTLTRAVELKPESFEAEYELGKSYWATGNIAEAEAHARKAVRIRPEFPLSHILLGNVALRKNDPTTALAELTEYLKLDPKGPFAQPVHDQIAKIQKSTGAQ